MLLSFPITAIIYFVKYFIIIPIFGMLSHILARFFFMLPHIIKQRQRFVCLWISHGMIQSANNLNIVGINNDNKMNNKNIIYKQGKWKLNDSYKYI